MAQHHNNSRKHDVINVAKTNSLQKQNLIRPIFLLYYLASITELSTMFALGAAAESKQQKAPAQTGGLAANRH